MLYLILNRDNATKYVLPYLANLKPMREDLTAELKTNKPKFVLYDRSSWVVDDINNIVRLPEVELYIFQNYSKINTINNINIYKINLN